MYFHRGRSVTSVAETENTLLSRRDLIGQTKFSQGSFRQGEPNNNGNKQANATSNFKVNLDNKILRCFCGIVILVKISICTCAVPDVPCF